VASDPSGVKPGSAGFTAAVLALRAVEPKLLLWVVNDGQVGLVLKPGRSQPTGMAVG